MRVRPILAKVAVAVVFFFLLMLAVRVVRHVPVPTPNTGEAPIAAAPGGTPARALADTPLLPICKDFYRAICRKEGETRDPTGTVRPDIDGEKSALEMFQTLVRTHPDWTSDQVDDELAKQLYTPTRRQRVETAYRWVSRAMERIVDEQPASVFSANEKHSLKERLRRTKLELPPPAKTYDDEPDLFTKSDVYYERTPDGRLRMRVGGAFLITVKSWFNMVFTMGHELAHSIDPCELKVIGLHLAAYDRLTSCFLRDGIIVTRTPAQECGDKDQLSEAFADWMAVQVTSEALRQFAIEFPGPQLANAATNAVRDLCEQDEGIDEELDVEMHPKPEVRISRIFGQEPHVREILGCAPLTASYCGFESEPPTPQPKLAEPTPNKPITPPLTEKSDHDPSRSPTGQ